MGTVSILFARRDSIYKTLPGLDVWDIDRDARLWRGGTPVVAHPPCRTWGRLRTFARAPEDEHALAPWAVSQVRFWHGVLEHPAQTTLWAYCDLPRPGDGYDEHGGWTLLVSQRWWGHRAEKPTWLYIVGCPLAELPPIPLRLGAASHVVQSRKRQHHRPHISKAEREQTPVAFARWLVDVAGRCGVK